MISFGGPAKLLYLDGHFDILEGGDHVVCAVSGQRIQLEHLKYWSVEFQEAYGSPELAAQRHCEGVGDGGKQ